MRLRRTSFIVKPHMLSRWRTHLVKWTANKSPQNYRMTREYLPPAQNCLITHHTSLQFVTLSGRN
jgi:hypothetical protein